MPREILLLSFDKKKVLDFFIFEYYHAALFKEIE